MNKRDENCIFCKILEGDIPSVSVYEDEKVLGILDISPAAKGHVLLIAKDHVRDLLECDEETLMAFLPAAKKIANAIKKIYQCPGINILQNNGEVAGQTEFHLHLHIIPRFTDDQVDIKWEKQNIDDFEAVAREIKEALSSITSA